MRGRPERYGKAGKAHGQRLSQRSVGLLLSGWAECFYLGWSDGKSYCRWGHTELAPPLLVPYNAAPKVRMGGFAEAQSLGIRLWLAKSRESAFICQHDGCVSQ
jgi:hypothetical protein